MLPANVLLFDDGKNKKIGNPYLKAISFTGKIESHGKELIKDDTHIKDIYYEITTEEFMIYRISFDFLK